MKRSGLLVLATINACVVARAADATTPIDHTERNASFAPSASVVPPRQAPAVHPTLPAQRVAKDVVDRDVVPLTQRRAPIEMAEAREKVRRETVSQRPDATPPPASALSRRPAAISTRGDVVKPPTVAKYQDSLAAASAGNVARLPARDRATPATINRFVFRKNPSGSPAVGENVVVPAAGGSAVLK